jgi:hypothetical protein
MAHHFNFPTVLQASIVLQGHKFYSGSLALLTLEFQFTGPIYYRPQPY